MKIPKDQLLVNVETIPEAKVSSIPLVLLHGFTGSASDWYFLFDRLPSFIRPYAIDLAGHGKSSILPETIHYTTEAIVSHIHVVLEQLNLDNIILVGYSMGGRAALSFARKFPQLLKGLILESSTPGIVSNAEREERYRADQKLADFIENHPIEQFVDYWMNIPLFDTQKRLPADYYRRIRESKIKNNRTGLANSLRGFSTGIMPHLWNSLSEMNCRTLLITGELDNKYTEINKKMLELLPHGEHIIAEDCGHNIHLERPEYFLNLLNNFLQHFQQPLSNSF